MPILNLNNFLSDLYDSPDYGQLLSKAKQLKKVQEQLLSTIPLSLRDRCAVGQYTPDGSLLIYADNGAIATRLRHLAPTIQQKINKTGIKVEHIRLSIQPQLNFMEPQNTRKISRTLSEVAIKHLDKLSNSLPTGSPLQSSLKALLANQ